MPRGRPSARWRRPRTAGPPKSQIARSISAGQVPHHDAPLLIFEGGPASRVERLPAVDAQESRFAKLARVQCLPDGRTCRRIAGQVPNHETNARPHCSVRDRIRCCRGQSNGRLDQHVLARLCRLGSKLVAGPHRRVDHDRVERVCVIIQQSVQRGTRCRSAKRDAGRHRSNRIGVRNCGDRRPAQARGDGGVRCRVDTAYESQADHSSRSCISSIQLPSGSCR